MKKQTLTLSIALFLPSMAMATDCGSYSILAVQAQKSDVLIEVEKSGATYWKELGLYTSASTKFYTSLAQEAMADGSRLYLRYGDGYTCDTNDFSTLPDMVRIAK